MAGAYQQVARADAGGETGDRGAGWGVRTLGRVKGAGKIGDAVGFSGQSSRNFQFGGREPTDARVEIRW